MRKLTAGVLIALAILALTAIIVSQSLPTQASNENEPGATTALLSVAPANSGDAPITDVSPPRPQARSLSVEAEKKPFIGITIETLDEGEAGELGLAGGAVVRDVLDDGPSGGLLQTGDIITQIGGEEVTSASDVVAIVKASQPGDVLSFTVIRDGESISPIDIEVGEGTPRFGRFPGPMPFQGQMLGHLQNLPDNFVKAELMWDTDDGVKTARAIAGTVANVDVENGAFDLIPADGSATISYEINDDTLVITRKKGDLGGLNEEDRTLVVDVLMGGESTVKLVRQGDSSDRHRLPMDVEIYKRMFHMLPGTPDGFLRGELVWETDDGFKTARAVVGTIDGLDVGNNTFDLIPADGSATISYEIDDDTLVITRKKGDLSGLNEEDRTLVVDVLMGGESTVKLVRQGEKLGHFQPFLGIQIPGLGGPKPRFHGFDNPPRGLERLREGLPQLQERLDDLGKDLQRRFQEALPRFSDDSAADRTERSTDLDLGVLRNGSLSDF